MPIVDYADRLSGDSRFPPNATSFLTCIPLRGLVIGNGLPPTARCNERCIEAIRVLLLLRCERLVCQSNRRAEREHNDAAGPGHPASGVTWHPPTAHDRARTDQPSADISCDGLTDSNSFQIRRMN